MCEQICSRCTKQTVLNKQIVLLNQQHVHEMEIIELSSNKCNETCTGCNGQAKTCTWDSSIKSFKLNCGEGFFPSSEQCRFCKQSCKTCEK